MNMKKLLVFFTLCVGVTGAQADIDLSDQSIDTSLILNQSQQMPTPVQSTQVTKKTKSQVHKHVLARVSKQRVEQYEKNVEWIFKKNSWMRWGTAAVTAAAVVGVAATTGIASYLPFVGSWFAGKKSETASAPITEDTAQRLIAAQIETQKQVAALQPIVAAAQKHQAQAGSSWGQSAKNAVAGVASGANNLMLGIPGDMARQVVFGSFTAAGSGLILAGVNKGFSPIKSLYEAVYHDGDMGWYLNKHVNLFAVSQDLKELAHDLAITSDEDDREMMLESFVMLYQKFVMCCEQILAFMIYKHKQNLQYVFVANGMNVAIRHINQHLEKQTNILQEMVNDQERYISVPAQLMQLEAQLFKDIKDYQQHENFLDLPAVS